MAIRRAKALIICFLVLAFCGILVAWEQYNTPNVSKYMAYKDFCDLDLYGLTDLAREQLAPWDYGGCTYKDPYVGGVFKPFFPKKDYIPPPEPYAVYVKKGSLHTLSYWQKMVTYRWAGEPDPGGVHIPRRMVYVDYSMNELFACQDEIYAMLEDEAYAAYSFMFTGDVLLQQDETMGYRVELLVEGRDADYISGLIKEKYGDMVQGLTYDKTYYHQITDFDISDLVPFCHFEEQSLGWVG